MDELLLEISFQITEAILEEKIEDSKEALKERFLAEMADELIGDVTKETLSLQASGPHFLLIDLENT